MPRRGHQTYPLTAATAMDYFALSPFYDRTCVNEVIKMQKRHGLAAVAAKEVSLRCAHTSARGPPTVRDAGRHANATDATPTPA